VTATTPTATPPSPADRRSPALAALPPYVFAELDRRKAAALARGGPLIDLGIGSPDRPIPDLVVAELQRAAADRANHGYPPFRGLPRFLESIERFMRARFGVSVDASRDALAVAGSKEGIAELLFATVAPGDVVLVPAINYPVYARASRLAGAEVVHVPMRAEDGFLLDLDAISAEDARRARVLIVNYPNNPTGATAERAFFERAVEFAHEHDVLLVSDLAYSELGFDGFVPPSALEIPGAAEVTVELHSCSKSFNMAGLRVGFAVGATRAIDALAAYRTNVGYGAPSLVQHAAAVALDHFDTLGRPVALGYQARRDAAVDAFRRIGWPRVDVPRAAMYLWLRTADGVDDWTFIQSMLDDARVVVTPGSAFGTAGANWFRLSLVADAPVLEEAISRMGRA
jgi:LL-diaminopimelate aminotransferase